VNARRLWAVLRFAICEARQLRVGWFATATILLAFVAIEAAHAFHFGSEQERFALELGIGVVHAAACFVAVTLPVLLIGHGLRGGIVLMWIAGRCSRAEWLLAYYGASAIAVFLVAVAGFASVAVIFGPHDAAILVPLTGQAARTVSEASVLVAVGVVAAVTMRSTLLAIGVGGGFLIACELTSVLSAARLEGSGLRRVVLEVIARIAPDLGTAPLPVYATGYLAVAVALFACREL
jgi:hypothetical protein